MKNNSNVSEINASSGNTGGDGKVSKAFVWFHATSYNGGAMAISATIISYFSLYVQESVGITAAQLATILLICNIWDAINDPLMGVLCESLHLKGGKYRPWFIFTPVVLMVDMWFLFSNPEFIQASPMAKCLWTCGGIMHNNPCNDLLSAA